MDIDRANMKTTREFWDSNPCGVHTDFEAQKNQRYAMEPWLPGQLERLASGHRSILEVGCGQGVDSIVICRSMQAGGTYVGIDYSGASIGVASANATRFEADLPVVPSYRVGDAENLPFGDATFDAVYSMGVIHHTADPAKAVSEVHRVLKDGGKAYILLYRRPSLKVGAAKGLRVVQQGVDSLLGTERSIYKALRKRGSHSRLFGTMFLECFGVPYMYWYNRSEIERLFAGFSSVSLKIFGPNFGRLSGGGEGETRFGYFWWVEATR